MHTYIHTFLLGVKNSEYQGRERAHAAAVSIPSPMTLLYFPLSHFYFHHGSSPVLKSVSVQGEN